MQLVLNTPGAYLRVRDGCFHIKVEDESRLLSPKKVESILISSAVKLSSAALQMAVEHNIDVVFLDKHGNPFGRLWHAKLGSTTRIRRGQLAASTSAEGLGYVLRWVEQKLDNQIEFLTTLANKRPAKQEQLGVYISQIQAIRDKLRDFEIKPKSTAHSGSQGTSDSLLSTLGPPPSAPDALRGLEGTAGRIYFEALSFIQPEQFPFHGRSRQPAKDEFNCILNYCYGVLYGLVERACLLSGLEPYLGFFHADNYNKKSLVFDLIEPYRIWAEETTVYLFSQRQVKKEMFDKMQNGMTLNKEGKQVVIAAFNERLDTAIRYKGRNLTRRNIIQLDCQAFAQELLKIDLEREPETE
ncbi:MAG: CRISPR-associated endonuclease Cas1 [candidate division KSB1 bacterium]|nr:CRISPR-associated endonuclease Cas1 [candidate division KSB1 bacterium]MDZ7274607.1 CRISPR-associated endonuclease Cas1 [candidate division KSB1 bacterium]MDZ7285432.1 CRISPR-associated endonuclease Cas1 [candidate division KSB1 bacterium]MDZ7298464.1 CRISPR-associated endonuclease Cas1 [candidate division KSB1 bacterium]MDZ7349328.1 CRISPR-associated endonuclease Cas1 [candidate division KSB1 bacterium]